MKTSRAMAAQAQAAERQAETVARLEVKIDALTAAIAELLAAQAAPAKTTKGA
jgi:hypothetical protein